ncbi:MAG: transposase [bacterium]
MITLASIIKTFAAELIASERASILPGHLKALCAMKHCRSSQSPVILAQCDDCEQQRFVPHSCGHRNCPHCQSHESQQWLERQLKKEVPADYFLITFTLPAAFRALAWQHQGVLYDMMLGCAWKTVKTFAQNDLALQGRAGAISVLHTHSRRLDYHPHVHLVMPAGAIDQEKRLWRTKERRGKKHYLFCHKALAKVFRAKMLESIHKTKLKLPRSYPKSWVVDCKFAGKGDKALIYLGRYLYKGVVQEKDIVACNDGKVSFRYQDSKSKKIRIRTLSGVEFLRLILQHVLPKGFRRTRNFGFLHPNSRGLIVLLQTLCGINVNRALACLRARPKFRCKCCGGLMKIIKTMIRPELRFLGIPGKLREMEGV